MNQAFRIWDLPTRLFHWGLALTVTGLIVTGWLGQLQWHFRLGYALLTLLLFRLFWGFLGGHWSRFATFWPSPSRLSAYLRGQKKFIGHNPMGALSILTMLLFLFAQVGTGLISDDEIATSGPLSRFVSSSWVSLATWYHKNIGKFVLIALVALHLGAVFFYLWRLNDNLIRPMWNGNKMFTYEIEAARDDWRSRALALLLLILCALAVALLLKLTA